MVTLIFQNLYAAGSAAESCQRSGQTESIDGGTATAATSSLKRMEVNRMHNGLIRELEIYAAIAEEGGMKYCADLMKQAAQALRKANGPTPAATGREANA